MVEEGDDLIPPKQNGQINGNEIDNAINNKRCDADTSTLLVPPEKPRDEQAILSELQFELISLPACIGENPDTEYNLEVMKTLLVLLAKADRDIEVFWRDLPINTRMILLKIVLSKLPSVINERFRDHYGVGTFYGSLRDVKLFVQDELSEVAKRINFENDMSNCMNPSGQRPRCEYCHKSGHSTDNCKERQTGE